MERLTKKLNCIDAYVFGCEGNIPVLTKLGHLEDIEEELGIPLEVLFKALKQGKIYTCASEYDKYSFHFIRGANMQNIHCISKVCPYPDCDFGVELKDYGKTWWLEKPKEELENAKD